MSHEKPPKEKLIVNRKNEFRKVFERIVSREKLGAGDIERAHLLATEGELYGNDPETKSLLENLGGLEREMKELRAKRMRTKGMIADVLPQARDIQKRRQDILELLVASVDSNQKS